ncbi:acyltransferase domain-containing protein [Streptomyces sp. N35]|uniref:acyltransferase domain-containing protein n=1 Tax=Streptomyces sp. N35 TaxID=2795730 RepID=UPI0018F4BA04|nr:acyltransferase domain-containing protein [Streptomyces sp. N35]
MSPIAPGTKTAVMFPGQGAYLPGSLSDVQRDDRAAQVVGEVLEEVDKAAAAAGTAAVSPLLTERSAPAVDTLVQGDPERLHLAIYAASLASYKVLTGPLGLSPDVVFGHSVGELTALVAGGALSIADGARLLAARDAAFRDAPPVPGGIYPVPRGAGRPARLVEGCGLARTRIAADNAPRQAVVSGPDDELDALARVLDALGLRHFRLRSAHPFHSPLLAPVVARFRPAVSEVEVSVPHLPVYSPTCGGYYRDVDEIRDAVVHHLVQPVAFRQAVTTLYGDGIDRFVETGPKSILADLVAQCLPDASAVAPLRSRVGFTGLRAALAGDSSGPVLSAVADAVGDVAVEDEPDASATTVKAEVTKPKPKPKAGGLPDRGTLIEELRALYAEELEYPLDVMAPDADLEADLAVDSVKQIELFSRALDRYGLPQPEAALRVTTYTTLERVAGLLGDIAGGLR